MPVIKLEQFSGPLDLLLSLIEERKLSISEISLSAVTEQFLSYLENIEEDRPEEMADFLVVASKLLLIKSRSLLPQLFPEEEDSASLADQLRVYRMFVDAAGRLNSLWTNTGFAFGRIEPPHVPSEFSASDQVDVRRLHTVFERVIRRLAPPKPFPQTRIDAAVSLKVKITEFKRLLKQRRSWRFFDLVGDRNNRTQTIVSFLAVLELAKLKKLICVQQESFDDIVLKRV